MPATSKAERRAMAIAEHHPNELYARNRGLLGMTHQQLHDFATTPEKHLPEHVPHPARNLGKHLKAPHDGIIVTNHHRGATRRKG